MICKSCGHDNPGVANFCSSCGAAIAPDDATATFAAIDVGDAANEVDLPTQMKDLASGDAMLLVKKGANAGSTYLLDTDKVAAGRHPDNDIFLDDVTVSRRHAEFRRSGGVFSVFDVGSLNGTYVNGNLVDSAELQRGDEVQIGKYKLVFLL